MTEKESPEKYSKEYFEQMGQKGGEATKRKLTPEQRETSARRAAKARWKKAKAKKKK